MEEVYTIGNIWALNSRGILFIIYKNTLNDDSIDVIGVYQDKKKIIKRIKRDSVFGGEVIKFYREMNGETSVRGEGGLQKLDSIRVKFTESKTVFKTGGSSAGKLSGNPFVKLPEPPCV